MLNETHLAATDLNLLVLFEVVLAEGNVRRAAERLHLSPSAVSHGLARLRRLLHDPVFLRTPRGVVPTARSLELAGPVAEILARVRGVLGQSQPFDPRTSTRHFVLGGPDGVWTTILPSLLAAVRAAAPGIDLGVRHMRVENLLGELDGRIIDVGVVPFREAPARFASRSLFQDDFVIAARSGHPWLARPTLARYCEMAHVVISPEGERRGFVDDLLARRGLARRVALAVPSTMLALSVVAETDLLAALPRRFIGRYAARFGVASAEPPLPLGDFDIRAVAPVAATLDAGVAWLLDTAERAARAELGPPGRTRAADGSRRARRGRRV